MEVAEARVNGERLTFDAFDDGLGGPAFAGDDKLLQQVLFTLDDGFAGTVRQLPAGPHQGKRIRHVANPEPESHAQDLAVYDDALPVRHIQIELRHIRIFGRPRQPV